MIKQNGKKFTIEKTVILTPKQKARYSRLAPVDAEKYILSIAGISKARINSAKIKDGNYGTDRLASKERGSVLNRFRKLLENGENRLHVPMTKRPDSLWVGVEIECLIEGEESCGCDSCSDGSVTCGNCDGRGSLDLEDDSGNDYRVDCRDCDGNGTRDCGDCDGSGSGGESEVHERVRRALSKANVARCSVKEDGSLSEDGHVGVEVTILFDASHGFDPVRKACKVLNDMGAIVNATCGLHVHLDMRDWERSQIIGFGNRLGMYLPILSRLVPSSRRNNRFCKLEVGPVNDQNSRYFAVNMASVAKHDTIEVRLHSGTTSAAKIEHWVNLLNQILKHETPDLPVESVEALCLHLKPSSELESYIWERFRKFNFESARDTETSGIEDVSLSDLQGGATSEDPVPTPTASHTRTIVVSVTGTNSEEVA